MEGIKRTSPNHQTCSSVAKVQQSEDSSLLHSSSKLLHWQCTSRTERLCHLEVDAAEFQSSCVQTAGCHKGRAQTSQVQMIWHVWVDMALHQAQLYPQKLETCTLLGYSFILVKRSQESLQYASPVLNETFENGTMLTL